jgi:hypothetical protein
LNETASATSPPVEDQSQTVDVKQLLEQNAKLSEDVNEFKVKYRIFTQ